MSCQGGNPITVWENIFAGKSEGWCTHTVDWGSLSRAAALLPSLRHPCTTVHHPVCSTTLQHPASNSHYLQSIQNWCDVRCDVTRTARTICDCPTPSLTLVPRRRWRYSRVLLPIFPPYLSMQPSQQDLQIPCLSSGGFPRHPSL